LAEIQDPSLSRKLRRRFDVKGAPPAPALAEEIFPVVLVADLTAVDQEDQGYERPCITYSTVGALAGNRSQSQLKNPWGSNTIITVELVIVGAGAAGQHYLRQYDTDLTGGTVSTFFRDRRLDGSPVGQGRYQQTGPLGSIFVGVRLPSANDSAIIPVDFVLKPGQGILWCGGADNVATDVTFYWTERQALPGEA